MRIFYLDIVCCQTEVPFVTFIIYGAVNFRLWRGRKNVDMRRYIKRFIFVKQMETQDGNILMW